MCLLNMSTPIFPGHCEKNGKAEGLPTGELPASSFSIEGYEISSLLVDVGDIQIQAKHSSMSPKGKERLREEAQWHAGRYKEKAAERQRSQQAKREVGKPWKGNWGRTQKQWEAKR